MVYSLIWFVHYVLSANGKGREKKKENTHCSFWFCISFSVPTGKRKNKTLTAVFGFACRCSQCQVQGRCSWRAVFRENVSKNIETKRKKKKRLLAPCLPAKCREKYRKKEEETDEKGSWRVISQKRKKKKKGKKLRGALSAKNVRKAQKRKEKKKIECADCRCLRRDGVHGFRVQGFGLRDQGLGIRDLGLGFRVMDQGLGFRDQGLGIRVQGLVTLNLLEEIGNILVIKRQIAAQQRIQNHSAAPNVHLRTDSEKSAPQYIYCINARQRVLLRMRACSGAAHILESQRPSTFTIYRHYTEHFCEDLRRRLPRPPRIVAPR